MNSAKCDFFEELHLIYINDEKLFFQNFGSHQYYYYKVELNPNLNSNKAVYKIKSDLITRSINKRFRTNCL